MDDFKLYQQYQDLSLLFPTLLLQKNGDGPWFVRGTLGFSQEYFRRLITDEYSVEILVPEKYPDVLPKIREVGDRIPIDFHHYQDESLCLGAPLAVKHKFRKDPSLLGFVNNCVIPYLYSFSYKTQFSKMPFGELSHGGSGILEYYQELFDIRDHRRVLRLIQILADNNYRGHDRCPCGSGKRLRACHGKILLEIKELQSPAEFQGDFNIIVKSLVDKAIQQEYRPYLEQSF